MTNPSLNQPLANPPIRHVLAPPKEYRTLIMAITGFLAILAGVVNFLAMYNFPDNAPAEVVTNFLISVSFGGTGLGLLITAMALNFSRKTFINFAHNYKIQNNDSTVENFIIQPEAHTLVMALNFIGYALIIITPVLFPIIAQ
jgi:hypothetical protein